MESFHLDWALCPAARLTAPSADGEGVSYEWAVPSSDEHRVVDSLM